MSASLGLISFKTAYSQSVAAPSYQVVSGVSYASPGGVDLLADLYLPKGEGPFPAVLFLHGGGWSSGDRSQLHRQAEAMAERGFLGLCIDYRLAPLHPYPAALEDSRAALVWLRGHVDTYRIDPQRIGVVGSSAGGHLAAMLGTESDSGAPSSRSVQAVVVFNGIFDLPSMPDTPMIRAFLGQSCDAAPERCRDASPRSHVQRNAPPFFVLHGDADQIAPYSQATGFVEALRAAGNKPDFYTAPGGPHTFWARPAWADTATAQMVSFLSRQLVASVPDKAGRR